MAQPALKPPPYQLHQLQAERQSQHQQLQVIEALEQEQGPCPHMDQLRELDRLDRLDDSDRPQRLSDHIDLAGDGDGDDHGNHSDHASPDGQDEHQQRQQQEQQQENRTESNQDDLEHHDQQDDMDPQHHDLHSQHENLDQHDNLPLHQHDHRDLDPPDPLDPLAQIQSEQEAVAALSAALAFERFNHTNSQKRGSNSSRDLSQEIKKCLLLRHNSGSLTSGVGGHGRGSFTSAGGHGRGSFSAPRNATASTQGSFSSMNSRTSSRNPSFSSAVGAVGAVGRVAGIAGHGDRLSFTAFLKSSLTLSNGSKNEHESDNKNKTGGKISNQVPDVICDLAKLQDLADLADLNDSDNDLADSKDGVAGEHENKEGSHQINGQKQQQQQLQEQNQQQKHQRSHQQQQLQRQSTAEIDDEKSLNEDDFHHMHSPTSHGNHGSHDIQGNNNSLTVSLLDDRKVSWILPDNNGSSHHADIDEAGDGEYNFDGDIDDADDDTQATGSESIDLDNDKSLKSFASVVSTSPKTHDASSNRMLASLRGLFRQNSTRSKASRTSKASRASKASKASRASTKASIASRPSRASVASSSAAVGSGRSGLSGPSSVTKKQSIQPTKGIAILIPNNKSIHHSTASNASMHAQYYSTQSIPLKEAMSSRRSKHHLNQQLQKQHHHHSHNHHHSKKRPCTSGKSKSSSSSRHKRKSSNASSVSHASYNNLSCASYNNLSHASHMSSYHSLQNSYLSNLSHVSNASHNNSHHKSSKTSSSKHKRKSSNASVMSHGSYNASHLSNMSSYHSLRNSHHNFKHSHRSSHSGHSGYGGNSSGRNGGGSANLKQASSTPRNSCWRNSSLLSEDFQEYNHGAEYEKHDNSIANLSVMSSLSATRRPRKREVRVSWRLEDDDSQFFNELNGNCNNVQQHENSGVANAKSNLCPNVQNKSDLQEVCDRKSELINDQFMGHETPPTSHSDISQKSALVSSATASKSPSDFISSQSTKVAESHDNYHNSRDLLLQSSMSTNNTMHTISEHQQKQQINEHNSEFNGHSSSCENIARSHEHKKPHRKTQNSQSPSYNPNNPHNQSAASLGEASFGIQRLLQGEFLTMATSIESDQDELYSSFLTSLSTYIQEAPDVAPNEIIIEKGGVDGDNDGLGENERAMSGMSEDSITDKESSPTNNQNGCGTAGVAATAGTTTTSRTTRLVRQMPRTSPSENNTNSSSSANISPVSPASALSQPAIRRATLEVVEDYRTRLQRKRLSMETMDGPIENSAYAAHLTNNNANNAANNEPSCQGNEFDAINELLLHNSTNLSRALLLQRALVALHAHNENSAANCHRGNGVATETPANIDGGDDSSNNGVSNALLRRHVIPRCNSQESGMDQLVLNQLLSRGNPAGNSTRLCSSATSPATRGGGSRQNAIFDAFLNRRSAGQNHSSNSLNPLLGPISSNTVNTPNPPSSTTNTTTTSTTNHGPICRRNTLPATFEEPQAQRQASQVGAFQENEPAPLLYTRAFQPGRREQRLAARRASRMSQASIGDVSCINSVAGSTTNNNITVNNVSRREAWASAVGTSMQYGTSRNDDSGSGSSSGSGNDSSSDDGSDSDSSSSNSWAPANVAETNHHNNLRNALMASVRHASTRFLEAILVDDSTVVEADHVEMIGHSHDDHDEENPMIYSTQSRMESMEEQMEKLMENKEIMRKRYHNRQCMLVAWSALLVGVIIVLAVMLVRKNALLASYDSLANNDLEEVPERGDRVFP